MVRAERAALAGTVASLTIHGIAAFVLVELARTGYGQGPLRTLDETVDLQVLVDSQAIGHPVAPSPNDSALDRLKPVIRPPQQGDRHTFENIDAVNQGRGGSLHGSSEVIYLLPHVDQVTLQDAPLTALSGAQTSRIRTSAVRASAETTRRATPNPEDETFAASEDGAHRRRGRQKGPQPVAASVPSSEEFIDEPIETLNEEGIQGRKHGYAMPGSLGAEASSDRPHRIGTSRPQRATSRAQGHASSQRSVMPPRRTARPIVDEGAASTVAERAGRTQDTVDAELRTEQLTQHWVESTKRSGQVAGEGPGGLETEGTPGTGGGRAAGGLANPRAPGSGRDGAVDDQVLRWVVQQRSRIRRHLRFPRRRAISLDQGTSVFRIVVRRDGSLAGQPRLIRSSGFTDLDEAALLAIQRSLPLSPPPEQLAPGRESIRFEIPIVYHNPMVR